MKRGLYGVPRWWEVLRVRLAARGRLGPLMGLGTTPHGGPRCFGVDFHAGQERDALKVLLLRLREAGCKPHGYRIVSGYRITYDAVLLRIDAWGR